MFSVDNSILEGNQIVAARLQTGWISPDLLLELDAMRSAHWVAHVNQGDYHGEWCVLPLRCLREHWAGHPVLQCFSHHGDSDWVDLPLMAQSPLLAELLSRIPTRLKSVRLMSLAPEAFIKPHRDAGLAWEYGEVRLHLPLRTDTAVDFIVDEQNVPMKQGELWYLNADVVHSVRHAGCSHRVHLVIDCEVNEGLTEWLRAAVRRGEATEKEGS